MQLRDIMTANVVAVKSDTAFTEISDIMRTHKIERIPVVDKGKLVGLVTKENLLRVRPSPATSLSVWEITSLLSDLKARDIMVKNVVTASADMTIESAIALAQGKKVGCLPVMEGDKLVGIVTTNDFFYKILNPLLGIGEPGSRITIHDAQQTKDKKEIYEVIGKHNANVITSIYMSHPGTQERDLTIHLDVEDVGSIVKDLETLKYKVEVRERHPQ
ncbi:CBS domain-containing protein [Chloroflexota bacterium]